MITSDSNDSKSIKNTEEDESSEIDKAHRNMDVLYCDIQNIKADIETISSRK